MRLDAWLRKDPSLPERLHVVVLLSRAVNDAHAQGGPLAGLDPANIEVSGASCDLTEARSGSASPDYKAPERSVNAPPTVAADVYAAGAIAWETLVGRPYAPSPSHLSEARNDLPGDLCDAVMACLESSPDWRPADLAYVAELAGQAAAQRGSRAAPPKAAPKPATAPRGERTRKSSSGRPSPTFEGRGREPSRSQVPVVVAAVVLLAAAGAGYFWTTRDRARPPAPVAASRPTAAPTPSPAATALVAAPTPQAVPEPAATVAVPAAMPTPARAPTPIPTPTARPTPAPPPAAAPAPPARVAAPRETAPEPAPVPQAPAALAPTTTAPADAGRAPEPAAAAARPNAALATLSPLSVRRPGKVLFDLHGSGLSADLQVRLVAVREAPRGITVVRQKCSGTICSVLVEFDDSVKPAAYALLVEDPEGRQSNPLTFTVTK